MQVNIPPTFHFLHSSTMVSVADLTHPYLPAHNKLSCAKNETHPEGSGSMGAEMLRGVYPERSEGLSMTARIPIKSAHREVFSPNVWISATPLDIFF
jgi:hypothetical protein